MSTLFIATHLSRHRLRRWRFFLLRFCTALIALLTTTLLTIALLLLLLFYSARADSQCTIILQQLKCFFAMSSHCSNHDELQCVVGDCNTSSAVFVHYFPLPSRNTVITRIYITLASMVSPPQDLRGLRFVLDFLL